MKPPLCVDFDRSLVGTNIVLECILAVIRSRPWHLVRSLASAFAHRSGLTGDLCRSAQLDVANLPYPREFVDFLRKEAETGRQILLVAESDEGIARRVAAYLGCFSDVVYSNGSPGRKAEVRLKAIRQKLQGKPFSYAGSCLRDLTVWQASAGAVLVGASGRVERKLESTGVPLEAAFVKPKLSFKLLLRAIRLHQWVKNLLVFVPIFLSHNLLQPKILLNGIRGFLAFSFAASSLYLVNDLLDLTADRAHPRKRHRPLASGQMSVRAAVLIAAVLLSIAFLTPLNNSARCWLAGYFISALCYSLYLKRLLVLDVILLAAFYTARILFGGAATGIRVSHWTLVFSLFLFLSLALVKRIIELRIQPAENGIEATRRGYLPSDIGQLSSCSAASAYLASLTMLLYIQSPEVLDLYSRPSLLYPVFPLLVYWQSRVLMLANRGSIHDDPVVFALRDRASYAVGVVVFTLVALAV